MTFKRKIIPRSGVGDLYACTPSVTFRFVETEKTGKIEGGAIKRRELLIVFTRENICWEMRGHIQYRNR